MNQYTKKKLALARYYELMNLPAHQITRKSDHEQDGLSYQEYLFRLLWVGGGYTSIFSGITITADNPNPRPINTDMENSLIWLFGLLEGLNYTFNAVCTFQAEFDQWQLKNFYLR